MKYIAAEGLLMCCVTGILEGEIVCEVLMIDYGPLVLFYTRVESNQRIDIFIDLLNRA